VTEHGTSPWPPSRRAAAGMLIAAAGLTLAIAASGTPQQAAGVASITKRLIIDVPDWLRLTVLVALALAALLAVGMLVRVPRRRGKDEEGYEHTYEPPKLTASDYVFLTLLAAIPLAVAGGMLWFSHWFTSAGSSGEPHGPGVTTLEAPLPRSPALPSPEALLVHSPATGAVLATLALLISTGSLAFMLWLYFGHWSLRRSVEPVPPIVAGLDEAAAESLEELVRETDPRRAIVKCYGRFEAVLAAAHVPRAPWQTPTEFMRSVLKRCALPHLAVWELTRLFELARFSEHHLDGRERDTALGSLASIRQALQNKETRDGPET
jgi:hypothetical protein